MSLTAAGSGFAAGPIAVFDSGVGGLSVLRALHAALPQAAYVYLADGAQAPYGERDSGFIRRRTLTLVQRLIDHRQPAALVLACNTATAAAVADVRARWPNLPVVGIEPALKPAAALSRTGHVGVLATRGTLASAKFQALHTALASKAHFVCQAADGLAAAIERNDAPKIEALCAIYIRAMGHFGLKAGDIDTLVLGCTHYPFAAQALRACVGPDVQLLDPAEAVARQTVRLLLLGPPTFWQTASLTLLSTADPAPLVDAVRRWLVGLFQPKSTEIEQMDVPVSDPEPCQSDTLVQDDLGRQQGLPDCSGNGSAIQPCP